MKKNKLVVDFDYNFELWGLSTAIKGYRLAWELNKKLGIKLIKQPDLLVGFKNEKECSFSYFSYSTPLNHIKLFKNRAEEEGKYFLVPEFPHGDYIAYLQIQESMLQEKFVDLVRGISSVSMVFSIPVDSLKSKSNFVF